ncbi:MAG: hypothetical protein AB9866_20660 [Syntrophobacteraceae bacterium]
MAVDELKGRVIGVADWIVFRQHFRDEGTIEVIIYEWTQLSFRMVTFQANTSQRISIME